MELSGISETEPAFAGEPFDVDDLAESDRVGTVLGFEADCAVLAAGECALDLLRRRLLDHEAERLAGVEADLDPDALASHARSAPRGRRGRLPGARRRPPAQRGPRAAARRSAPPR